MFTIKMSQRSLPYPVFIGARRQRGGSILGAFARFTTPLLGKIAKIVGSEALGIIKNVASDVSKGKKLSQSIKTNTKKSILRNVRRLVEKQSPQVGRGRKRSRRRRGKKRKGTKQTHHSRSVSRKRFKTDFLS